MYDRLIVSILRNVLPHMIVRSTQELIENHAECAIDAATAYMLGHMHVLAECPELITPISWPVAANMYLKGRSARLLNDSGLDDEETVCLQTMVSCREPDSVTSSGLHREACT